MSAAPVDVLLLGSGWTSSFLLPLLRERRISHAYTSRTPRAGSAALTFAVSGDGAASRAAWQALPRARCVVIVFPLRSRAAAHAIVESYELAHGVTNWIALGSTGVWPSEGHFTSQSPVDTKNARAMAESALLDLHRKNGRQIAVLNLAGLYGGERVPSNFAKRVGSTMEKLGEKGSVHLVHGRDVARAVVAVYEKHEDAHMWGRRWIISDGQTYDWWLLALTLRPLPLEDGVEWVAQLCRKHAVSSLPRPLSKSSGQTAPRYIQRSLEGKEFWSSVGLEPEVRRCDLEGRPEPRPFEATLSKESLEGLRSKVDAALEERDGKGPSSPFEADKTRFGLTHDRFMGLLRSWSVFLDGAEARKQINGRRPGADDNTWAAQQKRISSFRHYQIDINDVTIHYIREKPDYEEAERAGRRVIPLLLMHGWPGSFLEFLDVIQPLAHPGPSAPPSVPAFDVIVPSHTGYAFSSQPPVRPGKGGQTAQGKYSGPDGDFLVKDEARIMDALMRALGFPFYAGQAGDWASAVLRLMSRLAPARCIAVHLNFCPAPPPRLSPPLARLVPSPIRSLTSAVTPNIVSSAVDTLAELPRTVPRRWWLADPPARLSVRGLAYLAARAVAGAPAFLTPDERRRALRGVEWQERGQAYANFHGTRPSTLASVMESSPAALLAWIGEKFVEWTDEDPSDAEILASLTLWWCTSTMSRSLYPYRNRPPLGLQALTALPQARIPCPAGYSDSPFEILPTPLGWVRATMDDLRWTRVHGRGGHFFALERPAAFVDDMRDCFSSIWPVPAARL